MPRQPIIRIEGLSLHLRGRVLLGDLSLDIHEGEHVAVVGPNGAGKTTLLRCINRILDPTRGEIRIRGKLQEKYRRRELACLLGYVPQFNGGCIPFSVREYVFMGRYPHLRPFCAPGPRDYAMVRDALSLTGTDGFSERPLASLSGGERQKVQIAAALAQGVELLLLDEPATFLDPKHTAEINTLLARINKERGLTLVTVTHDLNRRQRDTMPCFTLSRSWSWDRCWWEPVPGNSTCC
ncbi:MAG: ABC transporter ATP-binding protein [Magnetococcales bacterium]|nr:ABC transporter ATP-binding protein [Magnetococcales bacterium]